MPVKHAVWKVGQHPEPLPAATLASEQELEDMIVASPKILSVELRIEDAEKMVGKV